MYISIIHRSQFFFFDTFSFVLFTFISSQFATSESSFSIKSHLDQHEIHPLLTSVTRDVSLHFPKKRVSESLTSIEGIYEH